MTTEKTGAEKINPYNEEIRKGKQVEAMFDSIAPAYDFMNFAMTMGLHRGWRDRALRAAGAWKGEPLRCLDIATGTGDVAFRVAEMFPHTEITGIDISEGMLKMACEKLSKKEEAIRNRISFDVGDSLDLHFPSNYFSMITVAYGVRNFEELRKGLQEMYRVMAPGGVLCVIELSCPTNPLLLKGYNLYSRHFIPGIGKLISGDSRAYSYLPESIAAAPQRNDMKKIMLDCGFREVKWKSLTLGVVTYYLATK
ncbi:MAG: bifunctional demethylmenaquinone methyltransferase/2-methoxy-6-polyprenyl-1,4-benzoquinol methylase UbiE [Bacteroidales bacterium]|nr:bifunctional demethylmenaquinone methyltransferase/2-methoxy-6-polyprenyl-1,4-benzoquinol methylase UbiE [Bacteroidales bacterium]MDE7465905.1 bifunctional demethylmenaquinone methyltransferase/2-methoxy-6-polyprenyl-1,4-benzoquinol methylase UbiE [Muribaculaceae bacterium]